MDKEPLISLCIPTNGVVEWMFPVLDSIFVQNVEEDLFEVVVTDNGENAEFNRLMLEYCVKHPNITYVKTTALPFLNEIESYKRAKGKFIKFLNHRTKLVPGALKEFIAFINKYLEEKPIVYFTNGQLHEQTIINEYTCFDEFVCHLSYWSSWSTGMAFWKEDFDRIPEDASFNELFPHTTILFGERLRNKYIVDDRMLLDEIPTGDIPKGRYDLFYAFAVEYPAIICDLLRTNDIKLSTFREVKEQNLKFVAKLYLDYVLRKKKCSYDLSSYSESINVFYSHKDVTRKIRLVIAEKMTNRVRKA